MHLYNFIHSQGYCHLTNRIEDLQSADAVVFHDPDFKSNMLPVERNPNQPYIVFSLESPDNSRFQSPNGKSLSLKMKKKDL